MQSIHFIKSQQNSKGETVYLWQRGHCHYEIEKSFRGQRISSSTYLNTSFEQMLEVFERFVK